MRRMPQGDADDQKDQATSMLSEADAMHRPLFLCLHIDDNLNIYKRLLVVS